MLRSCEIIKQIIRGKENGNFEFKAVAKLSDIFGIAKTICALGNTKGGGVLLVGVTDGRAIEGVRFNEEEQRRKTTHVVNICKSHIEPDADISFQFVDCPEGDVFCISVGQAPEVLEAEDEKGIWTAWHRLGEHIVQYRKPKVGQSAPSHAPEAKVDIRPATPAKEKPARTEPEDPTSINLHLEFDRRCLRKEKTVYDWPYPPCISKFTADKDLEQLHERIHAGAIRYNPRVAVDFPPIEEEIRKWISKTYASSREYETRQLTDLLRAALGHIVLDEAKRKWRSLDDSELMKAACRSFSARTFAIAVFKQTR